MTSSQDDSSHLTLDHNFEEARHNLFRSLCLEIRSAFINNNRQPALQLNLSSAFASCSNETEDSTDLLMIEPLQTLYRINQCNPGNALGTAASFNLQSGSQESSIIDSLWDLSPSSDNDEIASVWHVSVKGSETHDCDNQDVCGQEQNTGKEVTAPVAITTQWLNDDDLSPIIDIPSLAFAKEIPNIPDDHSVVIDPKSLLSDRNKSEGGEGDSDALADFNDPNAKLSLLLNLSSTINGTSEESDTEELEKFYPEVLDFETKKVFAERGTVRTIVRTMMRAAESRLSSSNNISKFTESTIDMCTRSSKSRCSNGLPQVEGDHMRPSEGESSHLGPAGTPSLRLSDSITASKDVDFNSTKSKNINSSIIDKLEGSVTGVINYGSTDETYAGDGHFECEAEKNPIQNDYTKFLSSCKSPSSLTYRKPSPSSIADITSEKKKKDSLTVPLLKRLSEFDDTNELNTEHNYQHQLKALTLNRPPSKDSHNVRNSIDDDDSIKRTSMLLHPQTGLSSSSKYNSRVSSPSDKMNKSSAVCLNDIGAMDDGVMPPSPYQIYLVNRLNALSPRPLSPSSSPSPPLHHPSHQPSFILLPSLPSNCSILQCQAEHLPVSTSPPSVTALLPSPERIQVNSLSESSYLTDAAVPCIESRPITPFLSSLSHIKPHCEGERSAFTPTRLLLFMFLLVGWTFYLLQRNAYVNKINPISLSPWIGQNNASMVINQRLSVMQEEYQSLLLRKDWHYLSTTSGTTAESLSIMGSAEHEADKHFIKVTAEFELPPFAVAEALQWDDGQLRYTLEKIDGYHGSLELLHTISSNMHLFKKTTKDLNFLSKRAMTSAITETATQKEFSVHSVLSEPSFLSRMMTSMLLPFLSSPIIPTSTPSTPTSTPAATPILSQDSASASTVPPSTFSLPPLPPLLPPPPQLPPPPLLPLLSPPPLQPSSAADSYTIPIGTITKAVVNINIDLESLPFTDPPLYFIFSLSQCHKLFESMTGISISDTADYLMGSFYYYYYFYKSYDIAGKADIYDGKKGVKKGVKNGVDRGAVFTDSLYHGIENVLAIFEQQEENVVNCFYDEITWFVELAGGRTRLISILHVDLGLGIPHWIAKRGVASNAVQSMILLKNALERDSALQQDVLNLELLNDQHL